MSRFKLREALSRFVDSGTDVVTAIATTVSEIPNVIHTFSKKYEITSKTEVIEDISESSIEGDLNKKIGTIQNGCKALGWD